MAQATSPVDSSACDQALAALQARQAALVAQREPAASSADSPPRARDARLEALRRHAARTCLGGRGDAPPPTKSLTQPIVVAPSVVGKPPPPLPIGQATLPPRRVEPPTFITTCDASGCWANDGTRLNRMGLNLLSPRGPCITVGLFLNCP